MWSIFKVVIEFVAIFTFWLFGHEACGILPPWPGMEPTSHALEGEVFFFGGGGGGGEVLTTGSPGKLILLSLSAGSRREGTVTHMHLRTLSDVLERNWPSPGPWDHPSPQI